MRLEQRHLTGYGDLLLNRRDTHARQLPDGSYVRRRAPVTEETIAKHLEGQITAGWYALGVDSTARWAVLDADQQDGLERLQHGFLVLDRLGIPSHLERSRRGGHLWVLLEQPIPAHGVRELIQAAVPDVPDLELYPKQDRLASNEAVGSLVRGPLGVHQLTGNRYPFVDPISSRPVSSTVLGTVDYLLSAEKLTVQHAAKVVTTLRADYQPPRSRSDAGAPSARPRPATTEIWRSPIVALKECIGDPHAFISQYVPLDAAGKGCCPFHPPDYRPSFALNQRTGRWTDFHEFDLKTMRYTSGDVIDFYQRVHGLTLREALHALRQRYA